MHPTSQGCSHCSKTRVNSFFCFGYGHIRHIDVVERRFIVQLRGADVRMEDVMSAADELDLDRLADLSKR